MFSIRQSRSAVLLSSALLVSLAACESEAVLPDPVEPGPTTEAVIDATSNSAFTHFTLGDLETVSAGADWDLALRRYEVRVNGGVAGPRNVSAVLLVDHSADNPADILAMTPASMLTEFESIAEADIPPASAFATTLLAEDASGWFRAGAGGLTANPARAWQLRLPSGEHAVLRVAALTVSGGSALDQITFEYRMQGAGSALGELREVTVAASSPADPTRVSLFAGSAVPDQGCNWDLSVNSDFTIALNDGFACATGSFPLETGAPFETMTDASDAPAWAPFLAQISSPIAGTVSAEDSPPFLYGIDPDNQHRLVPTFNIYLVATGDAVYKMQFMSYYDPFSGTAGNVSIRTARIR